MLGCSIEFLGHRRLGAAHTNGGSTALRSMDHPCSTRAATKIDEVYEEGIQVCAPLEMSDRYRFHSLQRPRPKLSDANDPRAGGESKRSSLFHSNASGLSILTDADLARAEREPSIPSIMSKSCSAPVFTVRPK